MNILHIIPALLNGGAERLVIDIVKELNTQEGIVAKLVIFREQIAYDISAISENLHVVPSSIQLSIFRENKFQVDQLQKFIDEFNPEVIHTHLFEAEIIAKSCSFPNATWFCHFHDNMPQLETFSLKTILNKKLMANYFERLFLIKRNKKNCRNNYVAISKNAREYAKKVVLKTAPVHYLKNAINVDLFRAEISTYDSTATLKLVNVGSFQKKKNQQFLIDVLKVLQGKGLSLQLTLLGDGLEKIKVMTKAKELGIDSLVQFKGNVKNVQDYLKNADIYVHSAFYEPFGLVILEAMAAGLPCVSIDGGGNRDITEHGVNGFIVQKQDAIEFAQRIADLASDKVLYQKIARAGQETAKGYDICIYVQRLLNLYEKAIIA